MGYILREIDHFKKTIWDFYAAQGRSFSWRETTDPYNIVVSEIMLQQTQTDRVVTKYENFIEEFPTFESLAAASLKDVLSMWQGLGYNRRGKFLRELAQIVIERYQGILPSDPEVLITLPGIGKATAGSIAAFAFNHPVVFIETNIRAVFIYTFFPGRSDVHDKELEPLVRATLDLKRPREWYYALTDYGVMLKAQFGNPCRRSKHHVLQTKFIGSDRQVRGAIVRTLVNMGCITFDQLSANLCISEDRLKPILHELVLEHFITLNGTNYQICEEQ